MNERQQSMLDGVLQFVSQFSRTAKTINTAKGRASNFVTYIPRTKIMAVRISKKCIRCRSQSHVSFGVAFALQKLS